MYPHTEAGEKKRLVGKTTQFTPVRRDHRCLILTQMQKKKGGLSVEEGSHIFWILCRNFYHSNVGQVHIRRFLCDPERSVFVSVLSGSCVMDRGGVRAAAYTAKGTEKGGAV